MSRHKYMRFAASANTCSTNIELNSTILSFRQIRNKLFQRHHISKLRPAHVRLNVAC